MKAIIIQFHETERGAIIVVTAIVMFALIGFASFSLDLGQYYSEGARLQNALDSAMLAAVKELPASDTDSTAWSAAKDTAIYYAGLNNVALSPGELQPIYQDGLSSGTIIGITATKSATVNYQFARIIGIESGTVTRSSSAGLVPAGGVRGAVPLFISSSGLAAAIVADAVTELEIKCSLQITDIGIDTTEISGWFGAIRFDGSGASDYSDLLAYGFSGSVYVGQVLDVESGNMSGPTLEGFTTRYESCDDGCTADDYLPGCPKLVYMPVVEVLDSKQVQIVSFAAFFLLECGGSGNDSYITATYLGDIVVPDAAPGTRGEDFGLYVGRLLG